MDSSESREIKKENNCNDFNEALQTDPVENEPRTIAVFVKCEGYNSSSGEIEADFVGHKAANKYQEQNEEKFEVINRSKASDNLSEQIKKEDDYVFLYKDIKSESGEEKSSELFSFCEMCIKGFGSDTDLFKCGNEIQCSCKEQSKTFYNEQDEVSPAGVTTDFGLQLIKVQDEPISGDEGNFELVLPAKLQKYYGSSPTNNPSTKSSEACPLVKRQGEKPFLCNICSKSFRQSYDLKIHQRIHTGEKPFQCNFCSKSFSRKGSLIVHEKMHTGEKPYCKICSKSFAYSGALTIHERIHTGEKPFQCNICSKAFTNSKNLRVHERIHTGEKPFRCKVCLKSFSQKCSLNYHEKIHTGEKSFHCKICSKAFTNSSHLKIHERIHTGEKPFQCKICLKSFNYSSHLRGHERIHTGERPYTCKTCSKSFGHKRALSIHEKIHLEEKPHSCILCTKSFCRKSALVAHAKTHIGEKHIAKSVQNVAPPTV